ncbi:1-propanol dehydrogenase PduQ [Mesobacillus zeae]
MNTNIFMGKNSLDRLLEWKNKSIMLISDPYISKSGMLNVITDRLKQGDNSIHLFDQIVPDPPIETIVEGMSLMRNCRPEMVIAVGGGSAIDAAKAIKYFAEKGLDFTDVPLIAIPTTSGTGSEVTSFSVITDAGKNVKYPLVDDEMLPSEAILDPSLVLTVPAAVTADTGMDVLTHAIEAYVSLNANDISDAMAEKAVRLVFSYLEEAHKNGQNLVAREKMHIASCMAGIAFNQTSLGLNHGIAHICGAKFHIPHGRINSILLPAVIEYNADLKGYNDRDYSMAAQKYAELAKILGLPASNPRTGVRSLISAITKLQNSLGMPVSLQACGVEAKTLSELKAEISKAALNDACTKTNPRQPTEEEVQQILEKIY